MWCFMSVSSQLRCFKSTIPLAQFFYIFLLLVTSASDLLARTIRFCSVVFGVTSSLAVKCESALGRSRTVEPRRLWLVIARGAWWSVVYDQRYKCHNLQDGALVHHRPCWQHLACCSINSRQWPTPHLHSTPPLRWFPSEYCYDVWYGRFLLAAQM